MTYQELLAVATKRGTVRWLKSGLVENLSLTKKGLISARPLTKKDFHVIWERKGITAPSSRDYLCVELTAEEKAAEKVRLRTLAKENHDADLA